MIRFQARLEEHSGGSLVQVPKEVSDQLGGRARIKVQGRLNQLPFRGSTMPTGDGTHCLGFRKDQRAAAGVEIGDVVTVELGRDEEERLVEVPPELASALESERRLEAAFQVLSYTRRKEMAASVASAKSAETRQRRLAAALEELRHQA
ncbi:MAG: YdeI/OmpD-associated family protein [Candidatus Dormibacteraeota bacterium]|nr:YdeI/OmpD-associated family protein [Candidatus Dormibacteraeota bacterium]